MPRLADALSSEPCSALRRSRSRRSRGNPSAVRRQSISGARARVRSPRSNAHGALPPRRCRAPPPSCRSRTYPSCPWRRNAGIPALFRTASLRRRQPGSVPACGKPVTTRTLNALREEPLVHSCLAWPTRYRASPGMDVFNVNPVMQCVASLEVAAIARQSLRCPAPVDFRRPSMSPIAS